MIIAANFKAFKARYEVKEYIDNVNKYLKESNYKQESIIFLPASTFTSIVNSNIILGAQNAYPAINGAFTGETVLEHLNEFDIKTILIGHSERRQILKETQEQISKKFTFFASQGFKICYCIGEPLSVKKEGFSAVMDYLDKEFEDIDLSYDNMMLAYEPIWAIGTGLTPTSEEIDTILSKLKAKTKQKILYGGSVKTTNVKDILSLKHCDGVLVGSDALLVENYIKMLKIASQIS